MRGTFILKHSLPEFTKINFYEIGAFTDGQLLCGGVCRTHCYIPVGTPRTPSINATELHTIYILLKKENHQKSQFTNLVTFFYKFLGSTYFWGSFTNYFYSNGVGFVLLYEYSDFFSSKNTIQGQWRAKKAKNLLTQFVNDPLSNNHKRRPLLPIFVGDCLSIFIALDYYKTYT